MLDTRTMVRFNGRADSWHTTEIPQADLPQPMTKAVPAMSLL